MSGLCIECIDQRAAEGIADDADLGYGFRRDRIEQACRVEAALGERDHRAAAMERRGGEHEAGAVHQRGRGQSHRARAPAAQSLAHLHEVTATS